MNTTQLPVDIISYHFVRPNADIYYPQVTKLENKQVQHQLNERIIKQVNTMIRKQYEPDPSNTSLTGGFELKNNQRDILSLANFLYAYTSGAAHGLTIQRSLTMDVKTGEVYKLKDLFKQGANYRGVLNNIIRRQIKERDLPLISEFTGIQPNQFFYIADKALVLYFQLYELVPYAWGFPYFVISLYEIQDIVLEDGALGRMSY